MLSEERRIDQGFSAANWSTVRMIEEVAILVEVLLDALRHVKESKDDFGPKLIEWIQCPGNGLQGLCSCLSRQSIRTCGRDWQRRMRCYHQGAVQGLWLEMREVNSHANQQRALRAPERPGSPGPCCEAGPTRTGDTLQAGLFSHVC